jgi:hypothetical protein
MNPAKEFALCPQGCEIIIQASSVIMCRMGQSRASRRSWFCTEPHWERKARM